MHKDLKKEVAEGEPPCPPLAFALALRSAVQRVGIKDGADVASTPALHSIQSC